MVTSSAARSRMASSSVATTRTGSRRAESQSIAEASGQNSPITLASESPQANSNAVSDVDMLDQEEGMKRWFKEVLIEEPEGFHPANYELLDTVVDKVLEEEMDENGFGYRVRFKDTHVGTVSAALFVHGPCRPDLLRLRSICQDRFVRVAHDILYVLCHPSFTCLTLTPLFISLLSLILCMLRSYHHILLRLRHFAPCSHSS